jgi:translation initiation factor IF-2
LVVGEFGHRLRRVAEADVEVGLGETQDAEGDLLTRAPVVTIMGHVDHGKTSLLDALRETDVAGGEAGGITQHIGAYQVELKTGEKITFLDTPGHEAFTAMRARGAKVTDIVVLVVAADDGIMPQTVEALNHAKAAEVPIIVAINKIDKPEANPERVRQSLLQHGIVVEELGGDTIAVEVSAKKKTGLDKLEETILLQAEVLELKANPKRAAEGAVVEARLDKGRGPVATVLVQRGTLRVGDIVVAGTVWGRVRALHDDRIQDVEEAGPAEPVEILGLSGTPEAGDDFHVVESEARAREISSYRERQRRTARTAVAARGTLEQMFTKIQAGQASEMPILVKTDVQGSLEAILASATKIGNDEVKVRIVHGAVGGINESDITLAKASNALIVGFNVRANKQARDMASRDRVEIRYYSIIYNLIDDLKGVLSGMLEPTRKEKFLGNAEILQIFDISKVGKVAGCRVTEGLIKRGAKVRLLRDNVVIHEGTLKTLKHLKDEVREIGSGKECGMAFENYQDIREGDVIEAFEIEEVARTI